MRHPTIIPTPRRINTPATAATPETMSLDKVIRDYTAILSKKLKS